MGFKFEKARELHTEHKKPSLLVKQSDVNLVKLSMHQSKSLAYSLDTQCKPKLLVKKLKAQNLGS